MRTPRDPVTATKVWSSFHDEINAAATRFNVPAQPILEPPSDPAYHLEIPQ